MKEYFDVFEQDIIERLDNMTDTPKYIEDLAYMITDHENADGSWFCDTYKAVQEIGAHFDFIREYMLDRFEYDYIDYCNPIINPEAFHCRFMIDLYASIFYDMFEIARKTFHMENGVDEISPVVLAERFTQLYNAGEFKDIVYNYDY